MTSLFWFAAGALSAVAVAFVFVPLRRAMSQIVPGRMRRTGVLIAVAIVFGGGALVLYRLLGEPAAIDSTRAAAPPPHPGAGRIAGSQSVESMESVTTKLEARIAQSGGSPEDWLLLAQSYEFLGRSEDAARARSQAGGTPAPRTTTVQSASADVEPSIAALQKRVAQHSDEGATWLELANAHRRARDFDKAGEAYRRAEALGAMAADGWADYADVLGSVGGGALDDNAARAIDAAIAIDPNHAKALWLKASLAHQRGRFSDSLTLWRKLRTVLPAGSSDARIVDLNIGEAERLVQSSGPAPETQNTRPPAHVTGTVTLDSKLAQRVSSGAALFIYAKAVDSPGPPLAVLRTSTRSWPVTFRLDDTLAMLPSRKLSSFDKVIVEARISRSGQATPGSGDLFGVSPVVRPADGKALRLVISREIG